MNLQNINGSINAKVEELSGKIILEHELNGVSENSQIVNFRNLNPTHFATATRGRNPLLVIRNQPREKLRVRAQNRRVQLQNQAPTIFPSQAHPHVKPLHGNWRRRSRRCDGGCAEAPRSGDGIASGRGVRDGSGVFDGGDSAGGQDPARVDPTDDAGAAGFEALRGGWDGEGGFGLGVAEFVAVWFGEGSVVGAGGWHGEGATPGTASPTVHWEVEKRLSSAVTVNEEKRKEREKNGGDVAV